MKKYCKGLGECNLQKYDSSSNTILCSSKYDCQYSYHEEIPTWKKQLNKIEQCPQRQDSLTNQMYDLVHIANRFGLYDAADYISEQFISKKC